MSHSSDDHARALLRQIALGASLAAGPFLGIVLAGNLGCACPTSSSVVHLNHVRPAEILAEAGGEHPPLEMCQRLCRELDPGVREDFRVTSCRLSDDAAPRLHCEWLVPCGAGRRLAGSPRSAPTRARSRVGAWLADVAALEAEAVDAFAQLARELDAHDAPAALVRAARRAAREEVGHARATARLARSHGATVAARAPHARPIRALSEIAEDNAREGCTREAYGALAVAHQATHAHDPSHRRVLARIAREEAGHALFSLDLAEWLAPRASSARLRAAREDAHGELAASLAIEPPAPLAALGLPDAERASALLAAVAA